MASPAGISGIPGKVSRRREYLIGALGVVLTVALCAAGIAYWEYIERAAQYGYLGVFFISIIAGATVIIPVPGLLVVLTLSTILEPAIVGALAGLGEALGSVTIYLTGYGGHRALEKLERIDHHVIGTCENWLLRRGTVMIFIMSSIVNPFFYPFAAVAGAMHYGIGRFFILCWAGKTLKNMAVAYVGFYGLGALLQWIGIGGA